VAVTVVVVVQPLARRGRPTLEQEVASPSASFSWREGQEEVAMEQMSTMMAMLERQE
jgi:hypothetical protein